MAQLLFPQCNSNASLLILKGLQAKLTYNNGAKFLLHTSRMSWTPVQITPSHDEFPFKISWDHFHP